jgi:hypothetical protein
VAAVVDFLMIGFLLTFFTVGFLVVVTVEGDGTTFLLAFGFGVAFFVLCGMTTFVDVGPLPLRPSMTIWPSFV